MPCCLLGSLGGFAEQVLELGEDLFDGVEVGTVWREEEEARASGPDGVSDCGLFVAGEVVHDDDVAWPQCWAKLFLDPCGEAGGVDRLIEDEGSIDPVAAQGGDEGHRLPVAIGRLGMEPLADRRPAPQRRHVGLRPGLVDEDEAPGIRPALELPPLRSASRYLGPELLGGKNAFF